MLHGNGTLSLSSGPAFEEQNNRRKLMMLLIAVLAVHLLAVGIPYFLYRLESYFNPPLLVIEVGLVDDVPGVPADNPPASEPENRDSAPPSEPLEQPMENADPLLMDAPYIPQDKLPDLPKPQPLPEQPATKPDTNPKDPPPIENVSLNSDKKIENPVKNKPPRKKPTADDILKNGRVITRPGVNQTPSNPVRPPRNNTWNEARAFAGSITQNSGTENNSNGRPGSQSGGSQGIKIDRSYLNNVLLPYISGQWIQPSELELNGKKWRVSIALNIAKSGQVLSARILSPSGNSAVDRSVLALIDRLKKTPLPAPPAAGEIQVNLITD